MSESNSVPTVVLWGTQAKPGREAEMKAFLTKAVTASRHDAGNIDYEAHEVTGEVGTFFIYERWTSREALDAHLHNADTGAPTLGADGRLY